MKTRSFVLTIFLFASLIHSSSAQQGPKKNAKGAYEKVLITNLTRWPATGEVNYRSFLCKNDKFTVQPGETWTGPGRGVCLITWISATLTGGPSVNKYTSDIGTSYSEFFITPSNTQYQIFSEGETPTTDRAPQLADKPLFNVGHMANTAAAVDWSLGKGANALEMDLQFDSKGQPSEFKHGGTCDCICWSEKDTESVCTALKPDWLCAASSEVKAQLRHVATKSSKVAMLIIDSKVDDLSASVQSTAGPAVVALLVSELFANGYKGFVLVSSPKWEYKNFVQAAAAAAKQSTYSNRIYVGVDMDNGGTKGARTTLDHLWKDAGISTTIYGSGISVCMPNTYYPETMLASWYVTQRRVRMADIWTLDKSSSMKEYIRLGARGVLTNKPGVMSQAAKDMGMALAEPGYLP